MKSQQNTSIVIVTAIIIVVVLVGLSLEYEEGSMISKFTSENSFFSSSPYHNEQGSYEYPHDDPTHIWNWTREKIPTAEQFAMHDCNGKSYKELYDYFHTNGYVIYRSCSLNSPSVETLDQVATFTKSLHNVKQREGDAQLESVRDLALDKDLTSFIEFIHGGRRLFPFQTLNFPKGTQQSIHSDLIHFDTNPRSLMAAAWTALEDMNEKNGPLKFYPKSHHYGTWDFRDIGLHVEDVNDTAEFQQLYGAELEKTFKKLGLEPEIASEMKKGESLIWAAGLCHGGSKQEDMSLTRLSQVTHYFFEGAESYWSPIISDPGQNRIEYRNQFITCHLNERIPSDVFSCSKVHTEKWKETFPLFNKRKKELLERLETDEEKDKAKNVFNMYELNQMMKKLSPSEL